MTPSLQAFKTPFLSGILVLDKPPCLSSMRVVAEVRRRAGGIKTGHAGTLDPLASGVLVLALGKATKALDQLMVTDKRYRTVINLSAFSNTDDLEGTVEPVAVGSVPDESSILRALAQLTGDILQRPPSFSAMKVGGRRAYDLSRRGKPPEMTPRPVRIHSLEVMGYQWPELDLAVHCAKGVYIRSLARDLGTALGTGGYCASIRRTAVGPLTLHHAMAMRDLPAHVTQERLMSVDNALAMLQSAEAGPGCGADGGGT